MYKIKKRHSQTDEPTNLRKLLNKLNQCTGGSLSAHSTEHPKEIWSETSFQNILVWDCKTELSFVCKKSIVSMDPKY